MDLGIFNLMFTLFIFIFIHVRKYTEQKSNMIRIHYLKPYSTNFWYVHFYTFYELLKIN